MTKVNQSDWSHQIRWSKDLLPIDLTVVVMAPPFQMDSHFWMALSIPHVLTRPYAYHVHHC